MKMMTEKMYEDVGKFWEKYREEHDIGENIMLMVIDMNGSINMVLNKLADTFISHRMSKMKFKGKSALEPKEGNKILDIGSGSG